MHFKQANSVASSRICLNLVTTSWSACISDMILVIRWDSVFSVLIPKEEKSENVIWRDKRRSLPILIHWHLPLIRPVRGLWPLNIPETARRVVESTGMAHCAMPKTNNSLHASSNRMSCKEELFQSQPTHWWSSDYKCIIHIDKAHGSPTFFQYNLTFNIL